MGTDAHEVWAVDGDASDRIADELSTLVRGALRGKRVRVVVEVIEKTQTGTPDDWAPDPMMPMPVGRVRWGPKP